MAAEASKHVKGLVHLGLGLLSLSGEEFITANRVFLSLLV